jgi:GlpG protein
MEQEFQYQSIQEVIASGQLWRLVTPIFIHFSYLHFIFNGLWLWIFGEKIEQAFGAGIIAFVALVTGITGNVLQAILSGASVIGGLSGVVYGLLGFIWMWQTKVPSSTLRLPKAIIFMMLLLLLLGFFGILDIFSSGKVANAAHLGGLIGGMGLGFLWGHTHLSRAHDKH